MQHCTNIYRPNCRWLCVSECVKWIIQIYFLSWLWLIHDAVTAAVNENDQIISNYNETRSSTLQKKNTSKEIYRYIYISEYYWSEHMSILRLGLTCACFFLPSHLWNSHNNKLESCVVYSCVYIFPTCQTTQAKENVGYDVVRAITCQRIKNMFFFGKSQSNSKHSRAYLEYILIFPWISSLYIIIAPVLCLFTPLTCAAISAHAQTLWQIIFDILKD